MAKRKLYLGNKIRRLREQHRLTQALLARQLDISPSYLNQIENDQRPVTAPVLLKLGSVLNVDLSHFSEEEDDRLVAELKDCLEDPLFENEKLSLVDIKDLVARQPPMARHFLSLFQAYIQTKQNYIALADDMTGDEAVRTIEGQQFPYEEVRDFFYYQNNYFHGLDTAAEQLFEQHEFQLGAGDTQLGLYLLQQHNVSILSDSPDESLRHFHADKGQLRLSKLLSSRQRAFHLAHQICLLEQRELLDSILTKAKFTNAESEAVCRVGLANYFAGALLMPYAKFIAIAERERYDIERLQNIFNCSFEQVCHRLSTLQRPGMTGIPFYFLRVDAAGNISKRQSASSFHFARVGGACPLWNVHEAFAQPGKVLRQVAQMPDGKTYFCIARTVTRSEGGFLMPQKNFAVGLGCEIQHASRLIYSAGIDLTNDEAVVPIGTSCRVCERSNCSQRAFPPIGRKIQINEFERAFLPYQFEP